MTKKPKSGKKIPEGAPGHPRTSDPRGGPGLGPRRRAAAAPRKSLFGPEEAYAEGTPLPSPRPRRSAPRGEVRFLHEDEAIIVVDKPSGLPVIAGEGSKAKCLYDIVTERIKRRNPKGRAAVVHRLDRDTSGVLVFARDAKSKKALMENWDDAARERVYVALVEGTMERSGGSLESWLIADGTTKVRLAAPGERGAKLATTRYRVLGEGGGLSLLELELDTGRKHQIRAQLAAAGHPVAGDPKYGSRRDPIGRLALHARLLVLVHPASGEVLRFESPEPAEFAAALRSVEAPKPGAAKPAPVGKKPGTKKPAAGSEAKDSAARPAKGAAGGREEERDETDEAGKKRASAKAKGGHPRGPWAGMSRDTKTAKRRQVQADRAKARAEAKAERESKGRRKPDSPASGGSGKKGAAPRGAAPRSAGQLRPSSARKGKPRP